MVPTKASSAERFLETGDRTSPVTNEGAVESGARTAELGTASPTLAKLGRILDRLDASINPQDMNLPGYRSHQLQGQEKEMWSVAVNGNWRVTFYFEGQDAILVDYQDYH